MKDLVKPFLLFVAVVAVHGFVAEPASGQTKQQVKNEIGNLYKQIESAYKDGDFERVKNLTIGGGTSKLKEMFDGRSRGSTIQTVIKSVSIDRQVTDDKIRSFLTATLEISVAIKRGTKVSRLQIRDYWMQDQHDNFKWKLHWRQ